MCVNFWYSFFVILCFKCNSSLCSKIGKLTLARLLSAHDAILYQSSKKTIHSEEILGLYSDLEKLDPFHSRYYKDEHSLVLLQQVILPSIIEEGLSFLPFTCSHYDVVWSVYGYFAVSQSLFMWPQLGTGFVFDS